MEAATRRLFTLVLASLARSLKDQELSVAQIATLHLVDQAGRLRQGALGEALEATPSTASRLVEDLVRRGLVAREEDPHDRRSKVLTLTGEGAAQVRSASEARARLILEHLEQHAPRIVVAGVLKAMTRFARGGPT